MYVCVSVYCGCVARVYVYCRVLRSVGRCARLRQLADAGMAERACHLQPAYDVKAVWWTCCRVRVRCERSSFEEARERVDGCDILQVWDA